jgi:hypothetical protein
LAQANRFRLQWERNGKGCALSDADQETENELMKETRDEIRARLLRDENVIQNIRFRAYEIWVLRGRVDGRQAEDWALSENEVVNFLIEHELKKAKALELVEEVAAAENEGMNLVAAPEAEIAPEKKVRKRPATKATKPDTATRKKTAASQESVDKKTAAKTTAAKRTTRRSPDKKSAKTEHPVVK